jgi:hypothetical protein
MTNWKRKDVNAILIYGKINARDFAKDYSCDEAAAAVIDLHKIG